MHHTRKWERWSCSAPKVAVLLRWRTITKARQHSRFLLYIAVGAMFIYATQCLGGNSQNISFENLPMLGNNLKTIDISSNGKWIAVESVSEIVIVVSGSGLRIANLGEGTAPIWSPGGKELAFFSSRSGDLQLWVWISTD